MVIAPDTHIFSDSRLGRWSNQHLQPQLWGQHNKIPRHYPPHAQSCGQQREVLCHWLWSRGVGHWEATDPAFPGAEHTQEKGKWIYIYVFFLNAVLFTVYFIVQFSLDSVVHDLNRGIACWRLKIQTFPELPKKFPVDHFATLHIVCGHTITLTHMHAHAQAHARRHAGRHALRHVHSHTHSLTHVVSCCWRCPHDDEPLSWDCQGRWLSYNSLFWGMDMYV